MHIVISERVKLLHCDIPDNKNICTKMELSNSGVPHLVTINFGLQLQRTLLPAMVSLITSFR